MNVQHRVLIANRISQAVFESKVMIGLGGVGRGVSLQQFLAPSRRDTFNIMMSYFIQGDDNHHKHRIHLSFAAYLDGIIIVHRPRRA